ncbi:YSL6, partial [Symbiodinium necroappetens]
MLLGPNINLSILLGGFLGSGLLGPWVQGSHECEASLKGAGNPSCWYYSDAPKYLDMKAYTLFPGIAMVVVDGFYSIVKLVFIVIKGFTKPNSYSNAGAAEEGVDDLTTQRELIRIFTGARIPPWAYIGGLDGQPADADLRRGIIIGMGMTDWNVSSSFGKLMMFPLGMLNH